MCPVDEHIVWGRGGGVRACVRAYVCVCGARARREIWDRKGQESKDFKYSATLL